MPTEQTWGRGRAKCRLQAAGGRRALYEPGNRLHRAPAAPGTRGAGLARDPQGRRCEQVAANMALWGRPAVRALRLWGPGGERAWARLPRFLRVVAPERGGAGGGDGPPKWRVSQARGRARLSGFPGVVGGAPGEP